MSSNDGGHAAHEDTYRYQYEMSHQQPQQQQQHHHQQQQQQHLHVPDAAGISQLSAHQIMWPPNHHHHAMLSAHASQPPPPQQFMHQTPPHLHQHQHQQQQHHQRYNEFMFNMHAPQAFLPQPGQPETYSVLPVGHGNFLKVYHCNDAPELKVGGIYAQQQQQQQQQPQPPPAPPQPQPQAHFATAPTNAPHFPIQAHLQQQQPTYKHLQAATTTATAPLAQPQPPLPAPQQQQQQPPMQHQQQPQIFNSYELFSSNPLLPAACEAKLNTTTTQQQPQLTTTIDNSANNKNQQATNTTETPTIGTAVAVSTTNMIINKLVNNWSPNLTGVAYTQFTAPTPPPQPQPTQQQAAVVNETNTETLITEQPIQDEPTDLSIENQQQQLQHEEISQHLIENDSSTLSIAANVVQPILATNIKNDEQTIKPTRIVPTTTSNKHNHNNNNSSMPEVIKKRIVAEVKPMRMTYSDVVLSKVNHAQKQEHNNVATLMRNGNKPMGTATQLLLPNERGKLNQNNGIIITTNTTATTPAAAAATTTTSNGRNGSKKSPTHEQKEATTLGINNNKITTKRSSNNNVPVKLKSNNKPILSTDTICNNATTNLNGVNGNNLNLLNGKKRNNNTTTNGNNTNTQLPKDMSNNVNKKPTTTTPTPTTTYTANNLNNNNNCVEKENTFYERVQRKTTATTTPTSTTVPTTSTPTTTSNNKSNINFSNNYSNSNGQNSISTSSYTRTRYSANNLSNSSSYSYSTKRQRGTYYHNNSNLSTYYGTSGTSTYVNSNRNYELAKKLLSTWFEYMLKILTWLFYLVYDIVVIGCSMAFDSLKQNALAAWTQLRQLRRELQQNSNKPGLWWRNFWRHFDARFSKNSIWAFWRRFYPKNPPPVTTNETFKSGRLPQTGEEAMYSLLNCKGKNAYSILGVPPDSSQEQIRKHYKKIAVLVHPDKNKQAGAEEAFKVLQRAFELIGEPENRHAYDQSLAEALHAEKAWSEFHDLLSQLHTKITEAANTIRCSTCSLRHPRKLTERAHYAARECASCKIRHSAREGDIWAESSFLGLRWKYLALMEGKVYDITEWANCQKGALSHLEPNSHMVQYRIVRGAQQQQQQQNQQQQASNQKQRQQSPGFDNGGFGTAGNAFGGATQYANDMPASEASLHEFLDNLYSGQNPNQTAGGSSSSNSTRRRSRRN